MVFYRKNKLDPDWVERWQEICKCFLAPYKDEEEDRVVLYVNLSAKKDSKEISEETKKKINKIVSKKNEK